jgi:iron-sulfur cluster assembly protein
VEAVKTEAQPIGLTPVAVEHLRAIIAKQEEQDLALRVYVASGGCSGFQYGMALDSSTQDGDTSFDQDGLRLVVDEYSLKYLQGAQVDYVDGLMGAGFTVHNPNATASCSCGQSFDTSDGEGSPKRCH